MLIASLFRRLWSWLSRRRLDRDFQEEIGQHLELKIQQNIASGMSPAEASRAAHLEFGNPTLAHEHSRQSWGFPRLESFWQDVRYGIRQLRKNPGFTFVAVMTLALGIGANVAIFSAVYSALLRPLPFKDSDRLLRILKQNPPRNWDRNAISAAEFLAWRSETQAFADLAAYESRSCVVNNTQEPEEDRCEIITSNVFSVLGVSPLRGRTFSPEEDGPGKNRVAILSYGLWQRRFGGDESMLGRKIQVNGEPATVVGIMPAGFSHLYASPYELPPDIWMSGIALPPTAFSNEYRGIGRLKSGVSAKQAQAEMDAVSQRLEQARPDLKGWRAQLLTLRSSSDDTRPTLIVLMGAVMFVLLIACANVANLLLARGAGRAGEFAVRKALGARQGRLVRQVLTESLLISLSGGALGIALAWWGSKGLAALAPAPLLRSAPGLAHAALEGHVLIFAVAVALVTTVLFGLAPAIQSARLGLAEAVKEAGRASLETRRSRRFRSSLVVSEIALAMVLLVGAGLMLRTLFQLSHTPLGFNPSNLLTLRIPLVGDGYKNPQVVLEFRRRTVDAIETLPGVESASVTWGVPLDDWIGLTFATAEDPNPPAGHAPDANYLIIGPDYFRTMQVPLLKGRAFNLHDGQNGDNVVIVNQELANRYWPGQDPLGKRLRMQPGPDDAPWLTVIGVAGNVLARGPDSPLLPEIYVPNTQLPWVLEPPRILVVRTRPGIQPESIEHAVVEEIHRVDKQQAVADFRTMEEIARGTRTEQRMMLALLGGFAALALVLSVMGIYSLLSYSVAQRTREIGVRMALGAQKADVLQIVVGNGAMLAILGIAVGVVAGLFLTRLMTELLYGVRATDPVTFCAVAIVLGIAALVACYIPARRAAGVDPMVALRDQ